MKIVRTIPEPEQAPRARDPWLDALFDGKLRLVELPDWKDRYARPATAASAIRQAAVGRGLQVTVAIRGTDLYVQARVEAVAEGDEPKPKAKRSRATPKA